MHPAWHRCRSASASFRGLPRSCANHARPSIVPWCRFPPTSARKAIRKYCRDLRAMDRSFRRAQISSWNDWMEDTAMATIETDYRRFGGEGYDQGQDSGSHFSITMMMARLEQRLEKRRSRRALLQMSDQQLKDVALSRSEADREARRRFWD